MTFTVHATSYGVRIVDAETLDEIAIETKDIRGLIANLSGYLPMDFNTVVSRMGDGSVISHTYATDCPPGCYGQLDECHFKKVYAEELRPILPACPVSESCYIWTPHLHDGVLVTPRES